MARRPPHEKSGTDVPPDLKAKALLVHERLCAAYECPIPYFHDLDPLSELISSLLSHRTRNADSGRAFKELRRRYPEWAAVRDAPTQDVEEAIAACTWPEQKAPRIQEVLRKISALRGRGELALDFLRDMPPRAAQDWLRQLPGVGPKTAAAVLSFSSLRMPALPVDCHHHRVAIRLALIGPKVDVAAAHALLAKQLPAEFGAQRLYDNHEVMMLHGQRCCYHRDPECARCPVLDLCPTGQARVTRDDPARHGHFSGRGESAGAAKSIAPAESAGAAASRVADAFRPGAPAEQCIEAEAPRPGEQQREGGDEVEQGGLFGAPLPGHEHRVAAVRGRDRDGHDRHDEERAEAREKPQRQEQPAAELADGGQP